MHFAIAQELFVEGTTTETDGTPIPGTLITVSETGVSTYSAADGSFKIALVDGYETLVFSFEGYRTEKVFVGGLSNISINLKSLKGDSDEIATGFGNQSKKEITGSISQIGGDDLGNAPIVNLDQANQGKSSGLQVQNSGGNLGEAPTVRIRGGSSLSNSNQPLYVVDGVPLASGSQANINPVNISSIEILKDASAAAIYGSRAANGVIIITTKSGRENTFNVQAGYQFGISQTPKYLQMFSPEEYRVMVLQNIVTIVNSDGVVTHRSREDLLNWLETEETTIPDLAGGSFDISGSGIYTEYFDTDWQKEMFRTGKSNNVDLTVQGGTKNLGYFSSISYLSQEGILIGNEFDRFNGSLSLDGSVTSKLTATLNTNFIHTKNNKLRENLDTGYPLQAILIPPTDAYDVDNEYQVINEPDNYYNPLTEINFSDNVSYRNSVIGSLGLAYDLTESIDLNFSGGIDYTTESDELRLGPETQDGQGTGFSQLSESTITNFIFDSYVTFNPSVPENHSLSVVLGGSYQKGIFDVDSRNARVNSIETLKSLSPLLESDSLTVIDVPSGKNVLVSAFGRLNYNFMEKYLFQLSARVDGSSKFGLNNRYGFFPAISSGWLISNESFMTNFSRINLLKLKASYGLIGNVPLDDFLYRTNYYRVNNAYSDSQGLRVLNYENPDLKWETTAQMTFGLEFGFLERVSASIEYYNKKTTDLLFPVPVSLTSGTGGVFKNLGTMTNSGVEINISSSIIEKKSFSWVADFNISFNDNQIKSLDGLDLIVGNNTFREGSPAGSFYLREYAGVNSTDGKPIYYLNPNEEDPIADQVAGADAFKLTQFGDRWVVDDWNDANRVVSGNPNPKYFGGLNNTISYKDIELSFLIQFVGDVDIYFETGEWVENSGYGFFNQLESQADRWYVPGDENNNERLNNRANSNSSTKWIENGKYARLKNLTLTYHLANSLTEKMKMDFLDFYVGGQNLLTLTNYVGYDPDVNYVDPLDGLIGQNITRGVDNFNAPQPRIFMAGIKIGI